MAMTELAFANASKMMLLSLKVSDFVFLISIACMME